MEKVKSLCEVIAAVRSAAELEAALQSPVKTIFLLGGDIQGIAAAAERIHQAKKHLFIHIDLLEGIRNDASGIRYIKETCQPAGLISTRPACLKLAHEAGMLAVLRVFLIDSQAVHTAVQHISACAPEFVEVLPGVSPQIIQVAKKEFPRRSIIAGGLIRNAGDIRNAAAAGAAAVSTSIRELWG